MPLVAFAPPATALLETVKLPKSVAFPVVEKVTKTILSLTHLKSWMF